MHDIIHNTQCNMIIIINTSVFIEYDIILYPPSLFSRYTEPAPESLSGRRESYMPSGGNIGNSLRIGEEEKELYLQKQLDKDLTTFAPPASMYSNYDNKKPSNIGPELVLSDSVSLPTDSSINPVTETTENINVSIPMAATAADSDTGSEDSTMNSDQQPLLDN